MTILPVLDLMNGEVVRGVAGRRSEYRPIVSKLTPSSKPLDVARAFRDHFGLTELYVADLDAIAGTSPAVGIFDALQEDGFALWIDAGTSILRLHSGPLRGSVRLIAGLESLSPDDLRLALSAIGPERLVFSLDLKAGIPIAGPGWNNADAWSIAASSVAMGIKKMIVLDLAQVGVASGLSTLPLCRRLRREFPFLELTTGGGVRNERDLDGLDVDYVLVASALHDGRIPPKPRDERSDSRGF